MSRSFEKPLIILVSGICGAGKSSFADAVEKSGLCLTHVPMDKYIMAIPRGQTFLQWVKEPLCVDWGLLVAHLKVLFSGRTCFTPKPDWAEAGRRISEGGALTQGPGRRIIPSEHGYVIPGTHVFSLPDLDCDRIEAWVETPDEVIASRLEGHPVAAERVGAILHRRLGDNMTLLRALRAQAELLIDGTAPHKEQVDALREFMKERNAIG